MKNTNKRQYEQHDDAGTACMDTLNPATGPFSLSNQLKKLKRGKQMEASDSYYLHEPLEFCAWGYPMELGSY